MVRWKTDGTIETSLEASSDRIFALDSAGNAYGDASASGGSSYAVKWTTDGQVVVVDPGPSCIVEVNASGTMVGQTGTSALGYHAAMWSPVDYSRTAIPDLAGFPGGAALGINDAGVVVGYSSPSASERPFRWTSALGTCDLGVLPGCQWGAARDINNSGLIVGNSLGTTNNNPYVAGDATLWMPDGQIIDLGRPTGSYWSVAQAINDSGRIVGYTDDGRALLWMPVPEPSSLLALLCGMSGLALRRRPVRR